jgi:hypothetical protein
VDGGRAGQAVSYGEADATLLRDAVHSVTNAGDAIMFTRTREGDALCVLVVSEGVNSKWYPTSLDAFEAVLGDLIEVNAVHEG